jgi:hypothetical protein
LHVQNDERSRKALVISRDDVRGTQGPRAQQQQPGCRRVIRLETQGRSPYMQRLGGLGRTGRGIRAAAQRCTQRGNQAPRRGYADGMSSPAADLWSILAYGAAGRPTVECARL